MKLRKWKDQNWFPYTVAACSAVVLFVLLTNLDSVASFFGGFYFFFSPVVIGIIIAYIMEPLVGLFERGPFRRIKKQKFRRGLCVLLAVVIVVAALVLILLLLIPQLVASISTFLGNFSGYGKRIQSFFDVLNGRFSALNLDLSRMIQMGTDFLNHITENIPSYLNTIMSASSAVGSQVMNWGIGIVLAIYFLLDKRRFVDGGKRLLALLLGQERYAGAAAFWKRCNAIMVKYIVCEILEALIVGILNFAFMLIMRMPYSVLVSVLVGVTNMIPTFGPLVGAVIGAFILVLADPWLSLAFLIFTVVLQFIDGYVLKPKMYGETLGVPAILILVAIVVGGKMFGIVGILLAIPFAAILSFTYKEALIPRLEQWRQGH